MGSISGALVLIMARKHTKRITLLSKKKKRMTKNRFGVSG